MMRSVVLVTISGTSVSTHSHRPTFRFRYDPVTVTKVIGLAQRRYLPDERAWEIPSYEFPNLIEKVGLSNLEADNELLGALKTKEIEDRKAATAERLKGIKPLVDFKPFCCNSISRMLKNEHYKGMYVLNRYHRDFDKKKVVKNPPEEWVCVEDAHEAIRVSGEQIVDYQEDAIDPEELENAAYKYVAEFGTSGEMHRRGGVGRIIESIIFTKEKAAALGNPEGILPEGWWIGFHIMDDEVWEKIKSGECSMFSIEVTCMLIPTSHVLYLIYFFLGMLIWMAVGLVGTILQ